MSENQFKLRNEIRRVLNECGGGESCGCGCSNEEPKESSAQQKPFYYLAPAVVGSINNLNVYPEKNIVSVGFNSTDGKNFNLIVPGKTVDGWMDGNEEGTMADFVKAFLEVSKPEDGDDEGMLDEIVDEDGNIIGAKDQPNNANLKQIGGSRKDSSAVIKQVVPKSKRYYGDIGLGFITW